MKEELRSHVNMQGRYCIRVSGEPFQLERCACVVKDEQSLILLFELAAHRVDGRPRDCSR